MTDRTSGAAIGEARGGETERRGGCELLELRKSQENPGLWSWVSMWVFNVAAMEAGAGKGLTGEKAKWVGAIKRLEAERIEGQCNGEKSKARSGKGGHAERKRKTSSYLHYLKEVTGRALRGGKRVTACVEKKKGWGQ